MVRLVLQGSAVDAVMNALILSQRALCCFPPGCALLLLELVLMRFGHVVMMRKQQHS
jgi:hypothetical protein